MHDAQQRFPHPGRVTWIGLRPGRDQPMQVVQSVQADCQQGLVGDRFQGGADAVRQVTLIQLEHLQAVAHLLRTPQIDPAAARRNLVISGINLTALKNAEVRIGNARLKITGPCPPCEKMERNLGPGGLNAMRGHGGVTACVLESGVIRVGDAVQPVAADPPVEDSSDSSGA